MHLTRILAASAAVALIHGAAQAQTPAPAAGAPTSTATPATAAPAAPAGVQKVVANGDIVATLTLSGQFKTFLKAVNATNLTGLLTQNKNLTVFAPTDAAFAALPPDQLARLMNPANKAELQRLLTYHIVNAVMDSSKIAGKRGPVTTVAGTPLELDGSGPVLMANIANVTQADVRATNGVIHVVDKVLMPGQVPPAPPAEPATAAPATPAPTTH